MAFLFSSLAVVALPPFYFFMSRFLFFRFLYPSMPILVLLPIVVRKTLLIGWRSRSCLSKDQICSIFYLQKQGEQRTKINSCSWGQDKGFINLKDNVSKARERAEEHLLLHHPAARKGCWKALLVTWYALKQCRAMMRSRPRNKNDWRCHFLSDAHWNMQIGQFISLEPRCCPAALLAAEKKGTKMKWLAKLIGPENKFW